MKYFTESHSLHPPAVQASYRHEYKYEIDTFQAEILRARLSEIMQQDSHTGETGIYQVRSLYFDDFYNSGYYDNENGNDPRGKYRIRIYNGSDRRISLELKEKRYGKTLKHSCPITRQQANDLMAGCPLQWAEADMHPLLRRFEIWQETSVGQPRVIVNYDRVPFVCPDGNVRVTLDMNIQSSGAAEDFFQPVFRGRPVMPGGKHILEVKFDEFIPDYIFRTIQTNKLRRVTCSKYYLCRKFGGIV